jgi:Contractile injection system tube protein
MSEFVKADLQVLDRQSKPTETIPVQFNPTTMQLQMSNSVDGGNSRGRQTQQFNGSSSTQLSLDLEFDTADEGTNDNPVDVRSKTNKVRQFVLPGGKESKQAPPRVKFRWGTFELIGVMTSLSEELSLFSRDGVPLRSKLSVQIKEQDPKFDALARGSGANDDNKPPAAGQGSGTGPGVEGGGPIDRAVAALAGETPADFLARNGLAPDAWRALGPALDVLGGGLELEAGLTVGFDTSLSVGTGVGVTAGLHVGLDASVDAALGLSAHGPTGSTSAASSGPAQGFALAAAGGVTAATNASKTAAAVAAADANRASFGRPATSTSTSAGSAASADRSPLAVVGSVRTQPAVAAIAAASPPRVDARTTTFGRGVPLRDRVQVPGAEPDGWVVIGSASPIGGAGPRRASQASSRSGPWERLAPSVVRDRTETERRDCGCHRCDPFGPRSPR